MILATHAIIGAAAASLFPDHPTLAFSAAFVSHFIFDAVPHWHYSMSSIEIDEHNGMNNNMKLKKGFFSDLLKIGLDGLAGLIVSYFIFTSIKTPFWIIILGVAGAILPDPLQFVYWKWRHEPLISLQRFHMWIHSKINMDNMHFVGIVTQIAIIVATVFGVSYIRSF